MSDVHMDDFWGTALSIREMCSGWSRYELPFRMTFLLIFDLQMSILRAKNSRI